MLIDIVIDKDYTISIECNRDNLLVYHSNVNRWNKSVKKSYMNDFNNFRSLHRDKIVHTYIPLGNTKTIKFAKMLGFTESKVVNNILYLEHKRG